MISCTSETDRTDCKIVRTYFGNDIPPNEPTRDYTYEYFYENNIVSKVIASGINGGNELTISYEFDANGRPFKTIFGIGEQEQEHAIYSYATGYLEITTLRISSSIDTISRFSSKYLYIENPVDDKIYHFKDTFSKNSYKFRNNNVYEFGYYTIEENDTINTFYQRYFYDDQPNTFYVPEYHVAVYPDYFLATLTSKNNIIQVDNFGSAPPFAVNVMYDYDPDGRLLRFKGGTGNTVDFEYDCN